MTSKKKDKGNKSGDTGDTEASLQDELSRESAEGTDSIGDVGSNRTVSGSSSWETLPEKAGAGGDAANSREKPGQKPGGPKRGKK